MITKLKTVSAKVLANKLNLPIVIVKSFGEHNQGLIEFLASFNFDCIFFFDEFEKNFSDKDSSILQIMDGVYTSKYRRIFLLTTNETSINDNLISRPSRLRYIHEFGNLEQNVVSEYLDDTLEDKTYKEDLMGFVDTLQISTIDILKSIVEEVNIFGFEKFMETKHFFNVKTASYSYRTIKCYCGNEESAKRFTIDKFLAEVKIYEKNLAPNRYQYENEEEYRKAYSEYLKIAPSHDPKHQYLSGMTKSAKTAKIGDYWGYYDNEIIVAKDLTKKVIITCEPGDHEYYYYYIENIDAKPSLYSDTTHLTNPYCIL